ncbi:MAG: 50S ribosomal protein L11 methyltransferase [Bacteroidota bacterium]
MDIGTGSGLLAMMAARAGAQEVVACEMNPLLAEAASQIVEQNGFQ